MVGEGAGERGVVARGGRAQDGERKLAVRRVAVGVEHTQLELLVEVAAARFGLAGHAPNTRLHTCFSVEPRVLS